MQSPLVLIIVCIVIFLIKYPRFNIHYSKYRNSCIEEQGDISHKSQYNLFSVGAFALLALVVPFERKEPMELGFFNLLLALTVDNSMEIPGSNGPNLWYMLSAFLYCVGLIVFRGDINSSKRIDGNYQYLRGCIGEASGGLLGVRTRSILRNSLGLFSAAVGIISLSLCPFSEEQFMEAEKLECICFIILALLLGFFIPKAPQWIDLAVKGCDKHFHKAMVNSFLLMIVSGVNFLAKYPRFKVHSKNIVSNCMKETGKKKLSEGNKFDLFSAAAFSLFALVVSSERRKPMKLGVFSFLLELTMDASIELLGNDEPMTLYVLGAAVYGIVLIFLKCYSDSYFMRNGNTVEQNDQEDSRRLENIPTNLIMTRDEIDRFSEHEDSEISKAPEKADLESKDDEEKEYEIININTEHDERLSMELDKGEAHDDQGLRRRRRRRRPTSQEVEQQKDLQTYSENQALIRSRPSATPAKGYSNNTSTTSSMFSSRRSRSTTSLLSH